MLERNFLRRIGGENFWISISDADKKDANLNCKIEEFLLAAKVEVKK